MRRARAVRGETLRVAVINSLDNLPDERVGQANRYVAIFDHPTFDPSQVADNPQYGQGSAGDNAPKAIQGAKGQARPSDGVLLIFRR